MIIASGSLAVAQDTPPVTPAPQYFTLNLPAGVSLISAPLNTGPGLARDSFLGLPPQWPLFFGWNPAAQDWVSGNTVPAGLAGGYWVYVPTPTTLVVAGQPYSYFTSVTKHIDPGWHLFGVPFEEGVGWQDFHLFASGNPIGLDTAVTLGWIDSQVTTTQGSVVQVQASGQPLLPGVAYWVHTLVPLELRAERQAGVPPATVSAPSPGLSQPVSADSSSPNVQSTSSTVMGWLSAIAGFLEDVTKGAAQAFEGNWGAAASDWAAGTFGLIEYGLEPGAADETSNLTEMDAKLDTLLINVSSISGQLVNLNNQISGLTNYITETNALGINLQNAQTWLQQYYLSPTLTLQSRNWARWVLAGCPIVADNPGRPPGCPAAGNPVTAANQKDFTSKNIMNPGKTSLNTDDFPLWWAYAVVGGANGVTQYAVNGTTADAFVTEIHDGLVLHSRTPQNALLAYMGWVFSQSGCTTDVSASGCDLYTQVYLPTEAFFLQAIGDQSQLAEAVAEADEVLAEKFPNSTHSNAASNYMSGVNQQVNEEVEAFLEVAEQIALYRAADGTWDWNLFGSSDAGQLLARADFVATQLGRQVDPTNPATKNLTPPWPSSGVVGRVFYVNGEPALAANATRGVCTSASGAFCATPVAQLGEDGSNQAVTGDWPYLLWQTASGSATGTPNVHWAVQRLKPATLPAGQYVVNSTSSARLGANLVVATYDGNYNSVPASTANAISFGSVNGIEGSIGKYGLNPGAGWTTTGGTAGDASAHLSISYADAIDAPGGAYLQVTYPPIAGAPNSLSGGATSSPWVWSTSVNISLATLSLASSFPGVHVHWPTTVNVNLKGSVLNESKNICGTGCGRNEYYSYLKLDQQLLDSKSKVVSNASLENSQCNSAPFNVCTIAGAQLLDAGSIMLAPSTEYQFKLSFSSAEDPYDSCFCGNSTWRSATAPSTASWVIDAPMLTLTVK